jgi:hypothetical protein
MVTTRKLHRDTAAGGLHAFRALTSIALTNSLAYVTLFHGNIYFRTATQPSLRLRNHAFRFRSARSSLWRFRPEQHGERPPTWHAV